MDGSWNVYDRGGCILSLSGVCIWLPPQIVKSGEV